MSADAGSPRSPGHRMNLRTLGFRDLVGKRWRKRNSRNTPTRHPHITVPHKQWAISVSFDSVTRVYCWGDFSSAKATEMSYFVTQRQSQVGSFPDTKTWLRSFQNRLQGGKGKIFCARGRVTQRPRSWFCRGWGGHTGAGQALFSLLSSTALGTLWCKDVDGRQ